MIPERARLLLDLFDGLEFAQVMRPAEGVGVHPAHMGIVLQLHIELRSDSSYPSGRGIGSWLLRSGLAEFRIGALHLRV